MADIGPPKRKIRIEPERRPEPARTEPRREEKPKPVPKREKVPVKTA